MAKKLEAGVTEIGTIKGADEDGYIRTFTILYGNVADPVIDGEVLHLEEPRYKKMLKEFLDSEEGMKYEVPSEEEVQEACEYMLNQENEVKQNQIKAQEEEERRIQEEIAEQERVEKEKEEIRKLKKEAKKPKVNKAILITTSVLLFFSLLGNVVQYALYQDNRYVTMTVEEDTFRISAKNLDVKAGENKIIIYGIGRSSDGNKVNTEVIPLGEFDLNKTNE